MNLGLYIFETYFRLTQAANLIPLMSQPGPLTVFAPTNAAFDLLPPAEFEQLLADPVALKVTGGGSLRGQTLDMERGGRSYFVK